ncbi:MAG: DNA or RNA helicase of superfamily II [Siphoviridae sp. ctdc_1]|nr:MAG: DNA or RNA helicase of superfamily II [Siphoviridae sp. ctdc_1]
MTITMRPYQQRVIDGVYSSWLSGAQSVCAVVPTGGGKTRIKAHVAKMERDAGNIMILIAHRRELIGQISMALAQEGIIHQLLCANSARNYISTCHVRELGRSYYSPQEERIFVASIDSFKPVDIAWFVASGARLRWTLDETHHLLRDNKWGKVITQFDKAGARGLGVTATPTRAEGKGLGRHADGLFDAMVEGPGMRELITLGYLSDYKVFCPPNNIDFSSIETSKSTGDYKEAPLKEALGKSTLTGDIVGTYLKHAAGKRGLTFTVDIDSAEEMADEYRKNGIPAQAISSRNTDKERTLYSEQIKSGELLQLVSSDLISEGYDVPAIEVASMGRPTQSEGLYKQQFGRILRVQPGKPYAMLFDHVGNVQRFGLPDAPRIWTLDRRERGAKKDSGAESLKVCKNTECNQPFEARRAICPHCGQRVTVAAEGGRALEEVEGDLTELSPEMLAKMRGEVERVMESPEDVRERFLNAGAAHIVAAGAAKQHRLRLEAQTVLRKAMISFWDFYNEYLGCDVRSAQITFWELFGTDVMSAQTLGKNDAEALTVRICEHLQIMGVAA